ncbi:hypothetical protein TraAM80_08338 [Trypanosoma rangeli]|uniref:Uncharacterized protein n=1 Tax=Trypanosoma rangeli TaxID=5698 RepID=A0A3R7KF11_TRYRA|nr:uncharacterized protein TraAM80_08338 [Trypanosoma rangeli]RNE99171.1 hypothetical protein TraAM80_08338 [Trypanosoma rangeli]|eukprot:RNE99171.1 hypothetical protein TraAM80_08338 [Trypanosoma rangeli]
MSLSAQEAIAYLRQFVNDNSGARFYVFPEPTAAVNAQALSFMECCWNSAVENGKEATASTPNRVALSSFTSNNNGTTSTAGAVTVEGFQLPLKNAPDKASVVFYDTPLFASPITHSTIPSDAGGFFSTAVVPGEQNAGCRRGRNGVAWVVL